VSTIEPLERAFLDATATLVASEPPADLDDPVRAGSRLTGAMALGIFASQLGSRHLDLAARWLRSRGEGFYTIGSSGHESNAAVAATRYIEEIDATGSPEAAEEVEGLLVDA